MSLHPSLLRLLHLASPALPIGAFHFSQGLEHAVEAGWIRDESAALEWIGGLAQGALASLDLPVLARLYRARQHARTDEFLQWDALLIASRETEELRAEDRHMGAALRKILLEIAPELSMPGAVSHAAAFAAACAHWQVSLPDALQAYAWAWSENQVLAAVKLVPLGQSAGQRVLNALIPRLVELATSATHMTDDQIGYCSVRQSMASARHERQYTRLFRS
jgi:urease accessory protein